MANDKKENNITKSLIKHKREILIGGVFLLVVLASIIFIIINNNESKENNDEANNSNNETENVQSNEQIDTTDSENISEEQMVEIYNFSKEDAKQLVMNNFNSDNFEYTVTISNDAMYIVAVKNTITDNVYYYEVNPSTKTVLEL